METGSEGSEYFHFFPIPFMTVAYDPVKMKLLETEVNAEEPINHATWSQAL